MFEINSQIFFLYIIISILVLTNIYLFYKTRKIQSETGKIEGFAVTDDMKKAINEIYNADIDAIRNLSGIATKITSANDILTIPANTSISGNTEIKGYGFIHSDLGIYGDLKVTGNVIFNNKNTNMMEIFPSFMIIMWLAEKIPKGWAICDGGTYTLGPDGFAVTGIVGTHPATPDLRGRFPIGVGQGTEAGLTNKPLWGKGGSETHTLTVDQMPSHSHTTNISRNGKGHCNDASPNTFECGGGGGDYGYNTVTISNTGGTQAHNNMPPYFSLIYYMKL
jgi:microcystin-dependent protein